MTDPVVRFDEVSYRRGTTQILDGVSLTFEPGSVTAIVGRSGAGKSTLLRMINRLAVPTRGRVIVETQDTLAWNAAQLRRRIGYVMQEGGLFPHLTVEANVGIMPRLQGWEPARIRQRARELLDMVGLPPGTYAARRPHELSGGQRQRVGLARALAVGPPILLMDEPFGALDPVTRAEVRRLFVDIQEQLHTTVVLVTHDMAEALVLGTEVVVMDDGRVVVRDRPARVASSQDPRVRPLLDAILVPPGSRS